MNTVTLFQRGIKQTTGGQHTDINAILEHIRVGTWQDLAIAIAAEPDKEKRQELKARVPYFTPSGQFDKRKNDALIAHSGLMAIDFDEVEEINNAAAVLGNDPFTFAVFRSISGRGLCVLVKVEPNKHAETFNALQEYYFKLLRLPLDPSGKDVARARYISFDPDLVHNPQSKVFKVAKQEASKQPAARDLRSLHLGSNFERILSDLDRDITGGYQQWRDIGFAIASEYGQGGEHYFQHISSFGPQYDHDITAKHYRHFCRQTPTGANRIGIGTFYYYAKLAGIDIRPPKSAQRTATMARQALNQGRDAESVKQALAIEGVEADAEALEAVFSAPPSSQPEADPRAPLDIEEVEGWVRMGYPVKRNAITRMYELKGRELETEDFNTMFIAAKKQFPKLSREIFDTLMFSRFTPTYNPLREYFAGLAGQWDGADHIGQLAASITSDTGTAEWRRRIVQKWLLGIVESVLDETPNILCLVLAGKKNTGKTVFFKQLLPRELHNQYFAASQLDKGKDDEILMCQRLIIFDDEYSGKSKQDAKHMKRILSADNFTLREPYGRKNVTLRRLATLCGTCNELEILNDPTGNRRILVIEATGQFDFDGYNNTDKRQLFAQVVALHAAGERSTLSNSDIDALESNTGEKFAEVSIELELVRQFVHQSSFNGDFMTATMIKVRLEKETEQRLNMRRLGMALKQAGHERVFLNRQFGYLVQFR
ncbi:MAG: VapE domain-containing protein [Ilumatobacteraceae bacterium]